MAKELAQFQTHQLIFANHSRCKIDFTKINTTNKKIYTFETINILHTLFSAYHLATSKYVFIDNYLGILSVIRFRKEVKCVQLWHAAGAVKKFGWCDPETSLRNNRAQSRFQKVYDQFHYIPVGSQQMANIFAESFHLDSNRFLYTGVPQTDFYFDAAARANGMIKVKRTYPAIEGKNVILYAPTFRKDGLSKMELKLNIAEMLEKLGEEYVLLIRLHPSVQGSSQLPEDPKVISVSNYPHINELLIASDILITDYSSIPVEFSLLRKKMIFFTYDLETYNDTQGLWTEESSHFPGPIVKTTAQLIQHILASEVDYGKIDRFSNHWNTFSTGQSTRQLVQAIYDEKDLETKEKNNPW
ncbi:CDP-glycerol glycerophosphotransferase family protein [Planococcus sp. 1R117A]|uniref:CDP-glycerol glycerophosphotransferase family protein n=1 Tax=Planococcus sp. 1R117A TaxID=3447020 RepID=UPI003EDCA4E4